MSTTRPYFTVPASTIAMDSSGFCDGNQAQHLRQAEDRVDRPPYLREGESAVFVRLFRRQLDHVANIAQRQDVLLGSRFQKDALGNHETGRQLDQKVVPRPSFDRISMVPCRFRTLLRTTSIPTPRPETSVTLAAVDKPGRKIN